MNNVKITSVHPTATISQADEARIELPTAWFPTAPHEGQTWRVELQRIMTPVEQCATLNEYLNPA